MAKACGNCGTESTDEAKFCGTCGTPFAAAPADAEIGDTASVRPVAPPPPPAPPAAAASVDLAGLLRTASGGGVRPALTVAATLLVVSLVLSLAVGLTTLVHHVPQWHWTATAVSTWIGSLWASIFGADLGVKASVHTGPFSFNGSGGISAVPVTLSALTLGAGVIAFKRVTAQQASLWRAGLTAAWSALFTVVPLLIVTLFVGMNTHDIEKAAGLTDCASSASNSGSLFGGNSSSSSSSGGGYDSNGNYVGSSGSYDSNGNYQGSSTPVTSSCINSTIADAVSNNATVSVGPSSTQVFFVGFTLILVVLLGATLARRDLYAGKYTVWVRNLLRGPISGLSWSLVGLTVAGWIYFAFVYFLRPDAVEVSTSHLSSYDWMNILSVLFAAGANLGTIALGLGTWGSYGGSASVPGRDVPGAHHGLAWLASSERANDPGLWAAAGLAPLVLLFATVMIARISRREGPAASRWAIGTWVLSLLALFPLLDSWAGLGAHGSALGQSVSASSGFTALATFTVFACAAVIGLVVLAGTGGLDAAFVSRVKAAVPRSQPAAPVTYQVGDVVNGHRFNGVEWVPLDGSGS